MAELVSFDERLKRRRLHSTEWQKVFESCRDGDGFSKEDAQTRADEVIEARFYHGITYTREGVNKMLKGPDLMNWDGSPDHMRIMKERHAATLRNAEAAASMDHRRGPRAQPAYGTWEEITTSGDVLYAAAYVCAWHWECKGIHDREGLKGRWTLPSKLFPKKVR